MIKPTQHKNGDNKMKDLKLTKELTPKMVDDIKEYFSMFYGLITPIIFDISKNHGKIKKTDIIRFHDELMKRLNNAYPGNDLVSGFENELEDVFFLQENMAKFGHGGN
jgi:hypothetical protein